MTSAARIEGGLLGLLIGDALGVPYEFNPPERLPPPEKLEMTPPPGFRRSHSAVPPGTWSDDGAQALALLDSLLEAGRLDPDDLGRRLVRWLRAGEMAVDREVFDVGIQTSTAIHALEQGTPALRAGPRGDWDNGNGSLMRVLPLALWHQGPDAALVEDAALQSLPTHGHPRSLVCCGLYVLWARVLLDGEGSTERAWSAAVERLRPHLVGDHLRELDEQVLPSRPANGGGYVLDALHSARSVLGAGDYEAVVKAAVALGNDTDTTACIAGGLAGIRDGVEAIPTRWREALRGREILDPLLARLSEHAAQA